MRALLISKILIDSGATVSFTINRHWPMALMFLGFVIADVGALWLA